MISLNGRLGAVSRLMPSLAYKLLFNFNSTFEVADRSAIPINNRTAYSELLWYNSDISRCTDLHMVTTISRRNRE